ncbi:MAG: hypothetical protein AAF333_02740 [Planctomycetota bacterium]
MSLLSTLRIVWLPRAIVSTSCLIWGFALAGCNHPLAQRPHGEWASTRVMTDDPTNREARVTAVSREGFYTLAREWSDGGDVSPDAPPPGNVQQVYLDRGELLGFRWSSGDPDARVAQAVDGTRAVPISLHDGVHYVWYRENDDAQIVAQDFLLIVLGAALIVGIIALAANGDGSVEFNS